MKNQRAILLFGLAVAFAAGAAYTARQTLQAQNPGGEQAVTETVPVVVARLDLEAGAILRADQLDKVNWPKQYMLAGFDSSEASLDGRVLRRPISARMPAREEVLHCETILVL